MQTPATVLELVERFDTHRDHYTSTNYNEAQVRREFIDPLFEALGWDVQNKKGYAQPFKEVIHEDAVRVAGVTKAPDYSFRLGGRRIFFVEAKKPARNLKEDPSPAYQLRRYAWTAKLPVSILTDFEEFIVYDTRVKPAANDKASKARTIYVSYTEYPERWPEIAALFAPEAIRKGALDKYVQSTKKNPAPQRSTTHSSPRSSNGAPTSPATSPCATAASPNASSTSPCNPPSTASSFCASAKTAASRTTPNSWPCAAAATSTPAYASSTNAPTNDTTPGSSIFTKSATDPANTTHSPPT